MTQVARIGGQLLQDNLERTLADLAFDTDLLVVKRDNTLGIGTTTTPRNITISGTMRTTSGGSDPDIVFGNSLKVGDFTLASSGISTPSGDITIKSTHPQGYITTNGIGSNNFAVKGDGIHALQTNGGVGIKSEVFDGQNTAWESNGNYGNYWSPGPRNSASSVPNDMDRLYDYATSLSQSGTWTSEELAALDFDGDGDIQVDDCLALGNMNTKWVGGTAYPATKTIADHNNPTAFKAYIEKYYPASVPRKVQIQSGGTVTVTGNLHATGNITYGGTSLTIGDDSTDNAKFLADFKDHITPDLDNVYHMGKDNDSTGPEKGFKLFVQDLNADTVKTTGITYQGINLTKNNDILYVSNGNGSDTNEGYSPGGPYATITKALSMATSGTLIYVYPGTYQEAFPMTVPDGVTIQGDGIRSVEIMPTSATQSNDCFLLNANTLIENLAIKDFYYDSGNDKGYAFRLANNYNCNEYGRSPDIRNVTVINKGSTTSASDPRGYASGDAGRGALIDGSVVFQNSQSASILFHATTFIVPGAVGLLCRSGARVEWCNSFTYFAGTGIKLEQGTGRLQQDSTTAYGAELRAIASACVYGNKGVDANGANILAYLINQNFAYVGAGKDVTNDNTLTIRANEVVKTNGAKVYYTTQDQRGNYRVGDNFLVDLENERTSFDVESIFAENATAKIREGNNTVTLEPGQITQENIVISGNAIEATRSNIDFNSAGSIVFQGNVNAPQVDMTGNFTVNGAIQSLGDAPTDTVDFNTPISQDFVSTPSEAKTLGTASKRWNEVNADTANINTVRFSSGTVGTNETNADLYLETVASGAGKIKFDGLYFKNNIISTEGSATGNFSASELTAEANGPYDRKIEINGVKVVGTSAVGGATANSDEFIMKVARTFQLMTDPTGVDIDSTRINNMITCLNGTTGSHIGYPTAQLVGWNSPSAYTPSIVDNQAGNNYSGLDTFKNAHATVDYVWEYPNGSGVQNDTIMEVVEHVLHTLSQWGFPGSDSALANNNQTSDLYLAMQEARSNQSNGAVIFDISNYSGDFNGDAEYRALLMREYVFLLVISMWEYFPEFVSGGSLAPEWNDDARTPSGVQTHNPLGYALYNDHIKKIITKPNVATLRNMYQANNTGKSGYFAGAGNGDVILQTSANLTIDSTGELRLPKGTTTERPSVQGGLRYNNVVGAFEGVEPTGPVSLQGIYDSDRDTYLDLSNNQFQFVTAGQTNHTLNGILLESGGFSSDHKISIDGNVISTDEQDGTFQLKSNGTGKTLIGDLQFQTNDLYNDSNSNFIINHTNNTNLAYLKIENVNGIVPPIGTTAQRPGSPEVGTTRYNVTPSINYVETWNGSNWINAAGNVSSIAETDVEELAYVYNLILD